MARMAPTQSQQLLEQLLGPHEEPSADLQRAAVAQIDGDYYQLITAIHYADAMMYSEASMALLERLMQHPDRVDYDIIESVGHLSIPGQRLVDYLARHGLLSVATKRDGYSWNLATASVYHGRHDVLKALLAAGEDPHQNVVLRVGMESGNLLDYANSLRRWKCTDLLQRAGALPTQSEWVFIGCDIPESMEEPLVSSRTWVKDMANDFYSFYQFEQAHAVSALLRRMTTLSDLAQQSLLHSFVLLLPAKPGNSVDAVPLETKIKALRDVFIRFPQKDPEGLSFNGLYGSMLQFNTQSPIGALQQFSMCVAVLLRPEDGVSDDMKQDAKALLLELLGSEREPNEGWIRDFGSMLRWANCMPVVLLKEWDEIGPRSSFGDALMHMSSPWTKLSAADEDGSSRLIPIDVVPVN